MFLYNTKTQRKEKFLPQDPSRVTMYVCGPTVYSYAHIGNARPAVIFDVLARLLRREFPKLVYVRNITDIDDKINTAAAEQGVSIADITSTYTRAYHEDLEALGVLAPDIEPRVTNHIPQIIVMIDALLQAGHAYEEQQHVLFDVPSFDKYGELSHRNHEDMLAGARVEVAPYKRDPADFVLWKPSSEELPGWDSPWGRGRPGWHIECSTMAEAHLGDTIDIHGGGHDLIFPHHENENAQSVCAHNGAPFCRYWVHNGLITVESEKMAKSVGNILLVHDLLQQAPGEAIRLALLSAHYRGPLDWTEEGVLQARRSLDRLYQALRDMQDVPVVDRSQGDIPETFLDCLRDDLNTPKAMAVLFGLAREAHTAVDEVQKSRIKKEMLAAGDLLGLLQQDPEVWFGSADAGLDTARIERLIKEREAARMAKDFETADRIRDMLLEQRVILEDVADGTRWRVDR
jgi:cysteinyl-tRNA synthetase